tara:strand:- start:844 stop:2580 length:1737 start_codon:yes stop_codon:yes gene_type:complete
MHLKFKKIIFELSSNHEDFHEHLGQSNISDKYKEIITGLAEISSWLESNLERKELTIANLRKTFGSLSEKKDDLDKRNKKKKKASDKGEKGGDGNVKNKNTGESSESIALDNNTAQAANDSNSPDKHGDTNKQLPKQGRNKGRNSASNYTGAQEVYMLIEHLKAGDSCLDENCHGKVYPFKSKNIPKISSHGLISAIKYILQQLRCNLCNTIYTAKLPDGVQEPKYDAKFKANLCVYKYYLGLPFYRIERHQKLMGVPLPDATQWDKVEDVDKVSINVYKELEYTAAQAEKWSIDDTTGKVLSLIEENKKNNPDRVGMYTTGIIAEANQHKVALFYTGRNYAKENSEPLLAKREESSGDLVQMSDALASRNVPDLPEGLEIKLIICFCLVHGRRKFVELFDFYPKVCYRVIAELAKVYKNDQFCRQEGYNAQQRLEYHKKHSELVMRRLHFYLQATLDKKRYEPNSNVGGAIKYMLKHWHELTQFLRVAGAQLDNNVAERALKIPIRLRKTAMFFKTTHGAAVGNRLMSIIYTCELNDINPVNYLIALQENTKDVQTDPKKWLPWNYHLNFEESSLAA